MLEKNKHPKTGKSIAPSIQSIKQAADGMNMDFNVLFNMLDGDVTIQEELPLTQKDEKDIAKRLENTLSDLENSQNALMFSGEPLDDETRELLKASLENSIRIAKINAKQKFTPKKYRSDNKGK